MPDQKCAICGVRPEKGKSTKGYFLVPTENVAKGQWQNVIPCEVTTSTRVCFRHWAEEHLELTTKVSYKKGNFTENLCKIEFRENSRQIGQWKIEFYFTYFTKNSRQINKHGQQTNM